ncbi:restriction endonuclease subunit S [Exiguobacterium sp. 22311]|uniref:restriction endonuclease subunit S n=1 Tax=Exiguobacterium sp. 22311 TaxID=3453907 RepID=UPI003F83F9DB
MLKNSIVYSSRAPIGHINIMTTDYATNQGCKSFTPILVNVEYIYYALKVMTPYIQKKASGTTFKEISGTTFGSSIVPLPPLSEQSRIVEAIEMNMIALNKLKSKSHL